jgi:hypothetical protein
MVAGGEEKGRRERRSVSPQDGEEGAQERRTSTAPQTPDLLIQHVESRVTVTLRPALIPLERDLEVVDTEPDGYTSHWSSVTVGGRGRRERKRTEERRVAVPVRSTAELVLRSGPVVVLAEPALEHVDLVLRVRRRDEKTGCRRGQNALIRRERRKAEKRKKE